MVPGRLETDFNVKSLFSCFGDVITISCNKRNTNEQLEKFIEIGHGERSGASGESTPASTNSAG